VRLLKSQTRSLLQKIDMDSKMKKMAELQLSVVSDPKNRKAIENQVLFICMSLAVTKRRLTCGSHSYTLGITVFVSSQFKYLMAPFCNEGEAICFVAFGGHIHTG
jgi:hypothetical protein